MANDWESAEALRDRLLPADLRATLAWWLDREGDAAGSLPPAAWTRPGWFERASAWMAEHMALANQPPDGPARVVYLWPLSVVLRTPSPSGDAYLKAAAPVFAHEASITAALAARSTDAVPEVLDVEPGENWLLMRDIGGSLLGDEPAPAWDVGLAAAARLQRAWEGSCGELFRAGAARRTLDDLAEQVPAFVERLALGDRVGRDEHPAWRAAIPRLSAACARLQGAGVPETLVHGDLHPWNIARTPRGLIVFDWSDSAIGHPFVDLVTTVIRTDDVAVRRRLAEAYLSAWPEVSRDDREEVAGLAMVVGSLYQVQSYLAIFDSIDPVRRSTSRAPTWAGWGERGGRSTSGSRCRDGVDRGHSGKRDHLAGRLAGAQPVEGVLELREREAAVDERSTGSRPARNHSA